MRKRIANITLALLLAGPAFSLVMGCMVLDDEKVTIAYQVAFPGAVEDGPDDADDKDNEIELDGGILVDEYIPLRLSHSVTQMHARQDIFFREHHPEVGSPPPR